MTSGLSALKMKIKMKNSFETFWSIRPWLTVNSNLDFANSHPSHSVVPYTHGKSAEMKTIFEHNFLGITFILSTGNLNENFPLFKVKLQGHSKLAGFFSQSINDLLWYWPQPQWSSFRGGFQFSEVKIRDSIFWSRLVHLSIQQQQEEVAATDTNTTRRSEMDTRDTFWDPRLLTPTDELWDMSSTIYIKPCCWVRQSNHNFLSSLPSSSPPLIICRVCPAVRRCE